VTEKKSMNKYGATPGKLALIGILSIVLFFVVYRNLFSRSANPPSSVDHDGAVAATEGKTKQHGDANNDDATHGPIAMDRLAARLRSKPWPNFRLAEVREYDPFALPSAFPRPQETASEVHGRAETSSGNAAALAAKRAEEAAARAAVIAAIREQGVQVILQNTDEFVAVVGDQEVRVRDELAGHVVVEIGADGIELERMEAK
jgi:hypothetical protein